MRPCSWVATMPTTVSNFNKFVYSTTGYLGEHLPPGYSGALSAIDFYAMVADVVSTIAFCCANVITAWRGALHYTSPPLFRCST